MRRIDPRLQKRLDSGATTLCRCWRVKRRDGASMGFTDHDAPLEFEGTVFRASSGMTASAVELTTGLAVDNVDAIGALSDAGIKESDIKAGRYDRAEIEIWLVDWTLTDLRILLFAGSFGEIRRSDGAFEVEIRGLTEALNVAVGRSLHRTCDRRLGDEKCGVDLNAAEYSSEAAVAGLGLGAKINTEDLGSFARDWFGSGSILWLSGANSGLRSSIKGDARAGDGSRWIALWREPSEPVAVGDRFRIFAGCDKQLSTCRMKFFNMLNFRGFPFIPGDDWVAAYPKIGEVHDGSSRHKA